MPSNRFIVPPPLPPIEQKALAVVPKIVTVPSFLGSVYIVQHVLKNRERRSRTYHRLLLGMALHDCLFAVWTFGSSWWIPSETPGVFGNIGNQTTCTVSGFIAQAAGLTSILYNGMLTLYFLLTIRFAVRERKSKRIEPFMHVTAIAVGWGIAIAGLPLTLYNSFGPNCWIAQYPYGCKETLRYGDEATCTRGDNASLYRIVFYHAELWSVWIFSAFSMFTIFLYIRKNELATKKYQPSDTMDSLAVSSNRESPSLKPMKGARLFSGQALFFISVFCWTWIWSMVNWVVQLRRGYIYRPVLYLQVICVPGQGLCNFLAYVRPRLLRYRNKHQDKSLLWLLRQSLFPVDADSAHTGAAEKKVIPSASVLEETETKSTKQVSASVDLEVSVSAEVKKPVKEAKSTFLNEGAGWRGSDQSSGFLNSSYLE